LPPVSPFEDLQNLRQFCGHGRSFYDIQCSLTLVVSTAVEQNRGQISKLQPVVENQAVGCEVRDNEQGRNE